MTGCLLTSLVGCGAFALELSLASAASQMRLLPELASISLTFRIAIEHHLSLSLPGLVGMDLTDSRTYMATPLCSSAQVLLVCACLSFPVSQQHTHLLGCAFARFLVVAVW